jgi:hypothetical protein
MVYEQNPKIVVSDETKSRLDKLKIIRQEPYESVISRLIDLKNQFDKKFKEVQ